MKLSISRVSAFAGHLVLIAPLAVLASCSDEDEEAEPQSGENGTDAPADDPAGDPPEEVREVNPASPSPDADDGSSMDEEPMDEEPMLEPALPVVENPDHEALLSSSDPQLAANKRVVYDMWRTLLEARDTAAAEQYFDPGYIQHNPNADTGRDGVMAFFSSLGPPLEIQERVQAGLVAIVAERDLVAVVRVDARSEPNPYTTTWFDMFRLEAGVIAEHWDPATVPAGGAPRGYVPPSEGLDQQASLAASDEALRESKQLVYDMWRTLLDAQQVEEAPRFLAEGYIQHNPLANTGLAGFMAFFRQFAQPTEVQPTLNNFIEIIAEKDLVVLATLRPYTTDGGVSYTSTWFDMFRVDGGMLVEHWDTQTIPVD